MANKRSAASSRSRDLFRTEVSSLLADLGELAGEPGPHPVPSVSPPAAADPAADALEPVGHGPDAGTTEATAAAPEGEAVSEDEDLISFSPSYLPPLPPVLSPLTAAPEPAPPSGPGFSVPEPAPPPGPWAAAPEPEAPPEVWPDGAGSSEGWPEMAAPSAAWPEPVSPPAPWPSPPAPGAAEGGRDLPPEPPPAPEVWSSAPEPPSPPAEPVAPQEPAVTPGLWPFMSDLATAAGGWDTWPALPSGPASPTSAQGPPDATERWAPPPGYETPAAGQGWPPAPGEPDVEPAPTAGWSEPTGPAPAMEWPAMVDGAPLAPAFGQVAPPTPPPHPAPLPPAWPSPPGPPAAERDDLVGMAAAPAPPPVSAPGPPGHEPAEAADTKLSSQDITASELASADRSVPPWKRAPSSQPSRFPSLAELPGWRLDGPARRPVPTPGLTGGAELERTQRFRGAPPSDSASVERGEAAIDQAPPSTPAVSAQAVERPEPRPAAIEERASQAPPGPIPSAAIAAAPVPAAARPGLPLLPGGQAAPVSTRSWTLAAAMQPIAPGAPPAIRAAGAALPEPVGPVISRSRSSGVSVPFPAVVTTLVVVLIAIVVLIVLSLRG